MSTATPTRPRYTDEPTEVLRPVRYAEPRNDGRFEIDNIARDVPVTGELDAARLWTGGIATALVAALIGLVGTLAVRAAAVQLGVHASVGAGFDQQATVLLCAVAAAAALAATGLAHLLVLSTPRPLAYLGWIVGLATASAAVLPFLTVTALPAATAVAVIHLVIGMAIGSLVSGSAATSRR